MLKQQPNHKQINHDLNYSNTINYIVNESKPPSKVINVFNTKGIKTGRTRTIYGPASFHKEPKLIEIIIPGPKSVNDLINSINQTIKEVQSIKSDLKLCPSHPGWIKSLPGGKLQIDILFSTTGEDNNKY